MAAPTWTNTDTNTNWNLNAKGVASSGTANDAPTGNVGVNLGHAQSVQVSLSADSSQTLSGAGTLECWWQAPQQARWARLKSWDLSVATEGIAAGTYRDMTFSSNTPGFGQPVVHRGGWIVWVPNGVTVSSGGCTIYIDCTTA